MGLKVKNPKTLPLRGKHSNVEQNAHTHMVQWFHVSTLKDLFMIFMANLRDQ